MGYIVKVPPASLPVTLDTAKDHLAVMFDDDNALITAYISAATQSVERYTERAMITRTLEAGYYCFPTFFELPLPPLVSVVQITYTDSDGNLAVLDPTSYSVDLYSNRALVVPVGEWPSVDPAPGSVLVEYVCGYGDKPADLPGDLVAAVLLLVGHFYSNREQDVTGVSVAELKYGVKDILAPYRLADV